MEGLIHGYESFGIEINPLSRLIAKVKTTPLDGIALDAQTERLFSEIENYEGDSEQIDFYNKEYWFTETTQRDLAKARWCIERIDDEDIRDFFFVCLSSIIRKVSLADPRVAPPVKLNAEKFKDNSKKYKKIQNLINRKFNANVVEELRSEIEINTKRIAQLSNALRNREEDIRGKIVGDDARNITVSRWKGKGQLDKTEAQKFPDNSVDIVITSPPYINAQKYIRSLKLEMFWLGLVDESEIADLDAKLIGTERIREQDCRELVKTGNPKADPLIEEIYAKNRMRAFIVAKYYLDMGKAMGEIRRALKEGGHLILVVGNNTVCGLGVPNHEILSEIATSGEVGFRKKLVLVDEIRSRGLMTKRNKTASMIAREWVMVFEKTPQG